MTHISRRGFLAASAAMAATLSLPGLAQGQGAPLALSATRRTLDIDGRAASVMGLLGPDGRPGLTLDPGQRFAVRLENQLEVETLIHWHGQIPPNAQDGIPNLPMPPLAPGEGRDYDFAPLAGTHWMHSHIPTQELGMLAAPLIVRRAEDLASDRQEVVMFLHDFSFKSPEAVMEEITSGMAMQGMDHSAMSAMGGMRMDGTMPGMDHGAMSPATPMSADLNDYDFDAYLANDRTLSDPEVVQVEPGGRVLLRVINAAAATTFWIDSGTAPARLVAVDGHPVQPLPGRRFGAAMAQRLDIEIDLPSGGAFPILALREGAVERTGIVLASKGAQVEKLASTGQQAAPAFDLKLEQEGLLRAMSPLADRPVDRKQMVMLGGQMQPYVWTIDGKVWEDRQPVPAISGERVELMFHNMSSMGHPMHLHGHVFQVVEINGLRFAGAIRDTVYVPPMAAVTVALDAGEAARWMLHCHQMPHLASGMMTEFAVTAG
ncbi:multicopper oxidase family protein (plasmid) [Limimaricola variabilis]|uniref:multicopper oxidase family protein n=1 Tax=Limimaricola variabilis TaxID=1492771 RepID=UPI002AC9DDA3|nr:multicopper oxidase family protein [Limimaricola variabilis]WPY97015.1 multicopper oxidase family protein [Limimaricola variabilis]